MLAALAAKFLPAIAGAVLTAVAGLLTQWLAAKNNQALGETVEASKVNVAAVQTQTAIAQAEASAPQTLDQVIARLKAGTA